MNMEPVAQIEISDKEFFYNSYALYKVKYSEKVNAFGMNNSGISAVTLTYALFIVKEDLFIGGPFYVNK